MKQLVTITMALLAGFTGGISGAFVFHSLSSTLPERVVRARSFEMVDEAGKVVSFWGIDDTQQAVLAFGSRGLALGGRRPGNMPLGLKNPDNQLAAFGLLGDDGPILSMRGEDLKTRVRLYLSSYGKPFLLMEDETGPRLSLGVEQSDTPGPDDHDWSLVFNPDIARIGLHSEKVGGQRYIQGGVWVNKDRVKYPITQPK